jgi:YidC/Oxa1 family membrane protein insertase
MPFVSANVFQPLIDVFEQVLLFFHNHVGLGWGLSIIALTVTVRAVLVPLTLKQFKSMQAMQRLAPEIKALQAKYKDDKQRLNQETMKFYQENQVNPFSSCLPLVLQMPVFISLFYMLRKDLKVDICPDIVNSGKALATTACNSVDPGSGKFLFIPDLTDKATGGVLVVLIVLYIGSQLLSSVLMSITADKNQRMIMIALPFVFTIFIINFPAGLLVYWITTNLWTVGQQYAIRRIIGFHPPPLPTTSDGAGGGLFGGLLNRVAQPPAAKPDREPAGAVAGGRAPRERSSSRSSGSSARGGGKAAAKPAAKPATPDRPRGGAAPPPPPRKKKKRSGRRR